MNRLPENLQQEISQKGFVVYHYISFSELLQTVKRDYLNITASMNIPLLIISVIIGFINPLLLFSILPIFYCFIFIILLWKMFWRTRKYVYISRVIFTEKNILIGSDVLGYNNSSSKAEKNKKEKLLRQYEEEFEEYLTRPSRLKPIIERKEKDFKKQVFKIFKSGKFFISGEKDSEMSKIGFAIMLAIYIYGISLVIFYYLGIFLGYIFFGFFALLLKAFLFFSKKIELQMKSSVEKMERDIVDIKRVNSVLQKKLEKFSGGEISDISDFVGEKFTTFYSCISEVIKEQEKLKKIISTSQYQKFIDFQKFSGYIRKQYNKPVQNMIRMLGKYAKKISEQKEALKNTSAESPENTSEFSAHLSKKFLRLEQMEKQAEKNLEKLRMMQI